MWRTAILFSLLSFGCSTISTDSIELSSHFPGDEWAYHRVKHEPAFISHIEQLAAKLNNSEVHRLLVARDGFILADLMNERYINGSGENSQVHGSGVLHDAASLTKSILSVLVGIAIDKGFIKSEEDYIYDYLKDLPEFSKSSYIKMVKIKHLLSMAAGIGPHAVPGHPFAEPGVLEMMQSDNSLAYLSCLSLQSNPGTEFNYNSLNYHLLSIIIAEVSGMSAHEFAQKYLFYEIGILNSYWHSDSRGYNHGWGDLFLNECDLLRFGHLINSRGQWQSKQIIRMEWIDKMLSPVICASWNPFYILDYGYGWFLPKGIQSHYYLALGRGGQIICILPRENAVVVTSGNFDASKYLLDLPGLAHYELAEDSELLSVAEEESKKLFLRGSNTVETVTTDSAKIDENWFGEWRFDSNMLGLETLVLKNDVSIQSGEPIISLSIEGRVISVEAVVSDKEQLRTHSISTAGNIPVHYTSRFSAGPDNGFTVNFSECSFVIKIDELEGINTYYLGFKQGASSEEINIFIFEHQLIPAGYTIRAVSK